MPQCNTRKQATKEDEAMFIKMQKTAKSRVNGVIEQINRIIDFLHYRLTDENINENWKNHIIESANEKIKALAIYLKEWQTPISR